MKKERLQNSISGSVFTLPVCSVITILLLLAPFADVAGTLQSSHVGDYVSMRVANDGSSKVSKAKKLVIIGNK